MLIGYNHEPKSKSAPPMPRPKSAHPRPRPSLWPRSVYLKVWAQPSAQVPNMAVQDHPLCEPQAAHGDKITAFCYNEEKRTLPPDTRQTAPGTGPLGQMSAIFTDQPSILNGQDGSCHLPNPKPWASIKAKELRV